VTERRIRSHTHQRLSVQYGKSVLLQQCVYKGNEKLKNGITSVMHEEVAGYPSTATNDNNECAYNTVLLRRQVTTDEMSSRLQISLSSAHETTQCCIYKWNLDICQQHLECCGNEHDVFLNKIIPGEEIWTIIMSWGVNG
jgi:hypothetical protein